MDRKRYTYVFGEGQSSKTANERFNLLSDALHGSKTVYNAAIEDAFSVEKLSDEFFYKYLGFYASFVKYITGEPTSQEEGDHKITERAFRETLAKMDALAMNDSHDLFNTSFASAYPDKKARAKTVRDYVKKMMGRLVFLHFLQRKGWMCSDRKFMLHLLQNTDHKDDFLDRVLEPLFFAVLNTHSKERLLKVEKHNAIIAGNKNKVEWDVAQIEAWSSIPYLNGGLFEEDHADGCRCIFPYEYFNALFDFFSQYNFTVDENDPSDAEVGVDPEMLSKIFESLLEDNKDKGAFYTPKEIVSYMCRSALSSYLKVPLSSLGVQESAVDAFVNNPQEHHNFTEEQRTVLLNSLRTVRICDPAIGSGAFPVGMMNLLYQCRRSLEGSDARAVDIKTDIIQHNIFGVDIEQGAVDIARLRFWLALVVDEEEAHALPNLDYRIVRGNSLLTTFNNEYINLGEDKPSNRTKLAKLKKQLAIAQGEYYNLSGEEKLQKEIDIKLLLLDIIAMRLNIDIKVADEVATDNPTLFDVPRNARQTKAQKEAIALAEQKRKSRVQLKELREKLLASKKISLIERARTDINFFDWDIIFSDVFAEKKGFDVVIGNPPYGVSIKDDYRKAVVYHLGNVPDYEIYYYFIEIAHRCLMEKGILSYIIPNTYLFNTYANTYRHSILQKWNVLEILDCTKFPVFKSAVVRNTINTWQKNKDGSSHVGYRNTVGVTAFDALVKKDKQIMSASDLQEMNQNWGLAFMLEPIVIRIVNKIAGQSESVINLYDVSQGYIPYRKSDLVKSYGKTEGEKIVKQRLWHSANKESEEYIQELYGRDISKYSYKSTGEYVKYGRHLACYVDIRFFNQDRIVVREITNPTIIACRLKEIYVHDPQLIAVIPKDDSSLNILWAVLNSKLATFYHFNHSPKATKGAFPKILVSDVKTFPLPNIDEETRIVIDEKVSRILSAKQSDPSTDTTALEDEIDFMVYKLYGLTYDEVLVVDPETPITREQYEAKKL